MSTTGDRPDDGIGERYVADWPDPSDDPEHEPSEPWAWLDEDGEAADWREDGERGRSDDDTPA